MSESGGKQVIGIFLGVGSLLVMYFLFVSSIRSGDVLGVFFGFGLGLILAIAGIVLSSIGIKQAKDTGGSKAKGVIGLIISIVALGNSLTMFVLLGGVLILETYAASKTAANAASVLLCSVL